MSILHNAGWCFSGYKLTNYNKLLSSYLFFSAEIEKCEGDELRKDGDMKKYLDIISNKNIKLSERVLIPIQQYPKVRVKPAVSASLNTLFYLFWLTNEYAQMIITVHLQSIWKILCYCFIAFTCASMDGYSVTATSTRKHFSHQNLTEPQTGKYEVICAIRSHYGQIIKFLWCHHQKQKSFSVLKPSRLK